MSSRNPYATILVRSAVAVLLFAGTQSAVAAGPERAGGCPTTHVALIDKLFHRGFTGADMTVLDEVFSPDIEFVDPNFPPGLAGLKALVKKNNASFEGWHFELDDVLCDGGRVTVRWRGMGTHVASFMGETPTKRDITLSGISIYTVVDGRIVADYVVPDNLGFLTQIGVIDAKDMTSGE
ncbi:MAG: ester cyclase [Gammaproteobacteria bacterium]